MAVASFMTACNAKDELKFKAFKLIDFNNEDGPALDENGNIIFENNTLATIHKDGRIILPNEKLVAQFKNDTLEMYGTMTMKSKIDKNGDMYENDAPFLIWNKDGVIEMDGEATGIRVEPNDPAVYQNASIVFLTFFNLDIAQ